MRYFKSVVNCLGRCEFSPIQYLMFYVSTIFVFGLIYSFYGGQLVKGFGCFWDGFYFSVITATTVGYGDMTPVGVGKLLTSFQTVVSIAIFAFAMSAFSERKAEKKFRYQNLMILKEKRKNLESLIKCMSGWGRVFETVVPKGDGFKYADLNTQLPFFADIIKYLDEYDDGNCRGHKYIEGVTRFSRRNIDNLRIQRVRAETLGPTLLIHWDIIIHQCERLHEKADEEGVELKQNANNSARQVTSSIRMLIMELANFESEVASLESA